MRRYVLIFPVVLACAFGAAWALNYFLFMPTTDAEINHALRSVKSGDIIPLTHILGPNAERVCWLKADYGYAAGNPEDYVSHMLGAPIVEFPPSLVDGEGGFDYMFVRSSTHPVQAIRLFSGWKDFPQNWCAPVHDINLQLNGAWWELHPKQPEFYQIPDR
jgi:hypothetical protein